MSDVHKSENCGIRLQDGLGDSIKQLPNEIKVGIKQTRKIEVEP